MTRLVGWFPAPAVKIRGLAPLRRLGREGAVDNARRACEDHAALLQSLEAVTARFTPARQPAGQPARRSRRIA